MPTRPLAHQLEDQSRLAFRQLLPPQWVCRDMSSDYGVDLQIEVFEEDGSSTGLKFYVQLKATTVRAGDDRKCRIKTETIGYFWSLELPCAIVHHQDGIDLPFSIKWSHTIDRYNWKPDAKSTTLAFDGSESWCEATPKKISGLLKNRTCLALRPASSASGLRPCCE